MMTMGKIRENYWIEKFRRLIKSNSEDSCKTFHKIWYNSTSKLLWTSSTRVFEITGLNFSVPLECQITKAEYGKAYLVWFTYATTRALYLDLVENMEVETFLRCLKQFFFFARRGNPSLMVTVNDKTFWNTEQWLQNIHQQADVNNLLRKWRINWKFSLSRRAW